MILQLSTLVAASALAILNFGGAHALTGNLALATVLACIATAQWAAARQAMVVAVHDPQHKANRRWVAVALLLLLYMVAAAWITVPLSAAKLDTLLGVARDTQAKQFADETSRLRQRASELAAQFRELSGKLASLSAHSDAMRDVEDKFGGSCLTSRGDKPGEISRFRGQEARLATDLKRQVEPQLQDALKLAATVSSLRLDQGATVAEAEQVLSRAVQDMNLLSSGPALKTVRDFVRGADEAGRSIQIPHAGRPTETFACVDAQRAMLLTGMLNTVGSIEKLPPQAPPLLMDASQGQELAKAKLIGGWSVTLSPLVKGSKLIDPDLVRRYRIDSPYVLTPTRISWGLAWALELVLLGLVALQVNEMRQSTYAKKLALALGRIQIQRLAVQPSKAGRWAADFVEAHRSTKPDLADPVEAELQMPRAHAVAATDAAHWGSLRDYMVAVGKDDFLVIPSTARRAASAAREAVLHRMAMPVVQGLTHGEVLRHPQIRLHSQFMPGVPVDDAVRWSVWRITSPALVSCLLDSIRRDDA